MIDEENVWQRILPPPAAALVVPGCSCSSYAHRGGRGEGIFQTQIMGELFALSVTNGQPFTRPRGPGYGESALAPTLHGQRST